MFQHQGVWFPDGEKHLTEWMTKSGELVDGKGTYQIKKLRAALGYVKDFRVAVDVGAHVGLWSMQLVKRFVEVRAFEPVAAFRECWDRNVPLTGEDCPQTQSAYLHPFALGALYGWVRMSIDPADTGGSHVAMPTDETSVPEDAVTMYTLDNFNLPVVDFLKIDCEGFEEHVVEGARETIGRCRPTIIVEQKTHIRQRNYGKADTPALDLLRSMGYVDRQVISGDYILTPA